ncbi:methylated-DNA-[protein]-cysteine S-methyltransferase [Desulfacinum infernum DSM 9756]|jgi:O-6-methylguanine DNA methyltransferase|uniref:Methylated-DNA--protein-cysteine methyltransferase n=1 Tax=Desulfacinum infernum DSM 9756 TaxID=1121391 RepID=A0A1M4ZUE2_9BACT|nr:methylated-DNA--[protein]-cysteine S-methyltransferase [Desulfacinum infernum]SHF21639.1 methylated-DNA-[protein]-cysteine S-methyltransferase [Desulfacinum infernum DSM 9756]
MDFLWVTIRPYRPVATIAAAATRKGVCSLLFLNPASEPDPVTRVLDALAPVARGRKIRLSSNDHLDALETQLAGYFQGSGAHPDVAVDFQEGTPFQRAVWQELCRISYGATRTYGEVAEAVGRPRAFRAVAQACGRNPVPIVVPCHRVVARDGLGGYSSGLEIKKALLRLEGAFP